MNRQTRTVIIGVAIAAVLVSLGIVPDEYVLNDACEPKSTLNRLRARLHGASFWEAQHRAIAIEIAELERFPLVRAEVQRMSDTSFVDSRRLLDSIQSVNPALRPSASRRAVRELRAAADEIEAAERDRMIDSMLAIEVAGLHDCGTVVERKARDAGL